MTLERRDHRIEAVEFSDWAAPIHVVPVIEGDGSLSPLLKWTCGTGSPDIEKCHRKTPSGSLETKMPNFFFTA